MTTERLPAVARLSATKMPICRSWWVKERLRLPSVPLPVAIQSSISFWYSGPLRTRVSVGAGQRTRHAVPEMASAAAHQIAVRTAPPRSPLRSRCTSRT